MYSKFSPEIPSIKFTAMFSETIPKNVSKVSLKICTGVTLQIFPKISLEIPTSTSNFSRNPLGISSEVSQIVV